MDTGTPRWGHLGKWDRARPERPEAQIFPKFAGLPMENHKTNQRMLFRDDQACGGLSYAHKNNFLLLPTRLQDPENHARTGSPQVMK